MNSYVAKLVFNIIIENKNRCSQFDEQVRIIKAKNLQEAFIKAKSIGKQEEETFINKNNDIVKWKFIDINGLYSLHELKDGEQIYSQTHETENTENFIDFIREKAMIIQTNFLTFA